MTKRRSNDEGSSAHSAELAGRLGDRGIRLGDEPDRGAVAAPPSPDRAGDFRVTRDRRHSRCLATRVALAEVSTTVGATPEGACVRDDCKAV